ncbi:MAG TPA: DUF1302 domain-containing protein [Moraxellaceae bacterium]|nr:DUF1302 domain-containing protein [Moraxellaceae bacterium]
MKYKNIRSLRLAPRAAGFALATVLPLAVNTASAFELDFDSVKGSLDTTVSYGAAWRTENPDPALSSNYPTYAAAVAANRRTFINKNDGDANFDNNSTPVASVFKITSDLELKYDNLGMFVRGTAFYDTTIMDNPPRGASPNYYPNASDCNVQTTLTPQNCGWPKAIDDHSGSDMRFLDAYVYGNFSVANHPLNLRAGQQVVNWGEALFLQDGINSANPVSLSKLRLPGAEVKEALLPLPMLYGSLGLTDNLTMEAFYEFDWDYSEADDAGTFYSTDDSFAGLGADRILVSVLNPVSTLTLAQQGATLGAYNGNGSTWLTNKRIGDKPVDNTDQFGVALRYSLNNTEFGLYYMSYDSHKPVAQAITGQANGYQAGDAKTVSAVNACVAAGGLAQTCIATANAYNYIDTTQYQLVYPNNINLYGFSFSTTVGDLSVAGELAYRPNDVILGELGDNLVAYNTLNAAYTGNGIAMPAGTILNNGQSIGPRTVVKDWVELETYNVDFTVVNNFGPRLGADSSMGILELGGSYIPDGENKMYASTASLLYLPYSQVPGGTSNSACNAPKYDPNSCLSEGPRNDYLDRFSWGYRAVLTGTYNDVFSGVALSPVLRFAHDVQGNSNRTGNFLQNRKAATVGVNALYNQAVEVGVAYNVFWGAKESNLLSDRDNVTATIKYSF